jgi:hypothetical protein
MTDAPSPFNGLPLTRRHLLERCTAGFGMVGLLGMLGRAGAAGPANPAVGLRPNTEPRAKRLIFLFMNGGPSHLDTFDPKPALQKYAGQKPDGVKVKNDSSGYLPSPFAFHKRGQSGIEVCETLPDIGGVIDRCCVIRSMHTGLPNHEQALLAMHCGHIQPTRPSLGSWLLYGLGSENQNLPGYVVLRPSDQIVVGPALWSNAFLPAEFQGTSVITKETGVEKLLANIRNPRWDRAAQRSQLNLANALNQRHLAARGGDPELEGQIHAMETAFRMQSEAMDTFDIDREPARVREAYGDSPFGRSCLLARRLSEAGVRVVSVYYTATGTQPWDTHADHNNGHRRLCADSDRATAALIRDLDARGLLDDTLVVWGGEFGRTPYAQDNKKGEPGRDHHHTAFSMLVAGGGTKPGTAYGTSDELGMHAAENPVHVHDFHATLLHLMGIDHTALTFRFSGRDFRLTDVHGEVVEGILA